MRDSRLTVESRLRWVRLALLACRRRRETGAESARILADEAHIRVYAIRSFGVVPGDEVQDPVRLCEAVFAEIAQDRDAVAVDTLDWRDLPPPEMLRLRRIKNLLTPLRGLTDVLAADDPLRRELTEWLALVPELP
ncbi:hypothetical protein AB0L35_05165 [Streptomyces sp. NPDC052309]|uniref:hypothetical protein n=1 Tax=Streptomyces sp. NPDC052309 TaxID=3155421 RepID=UPI00342054A2